jgi:hypothetical protein
VNFIYWFNGDNYVEALMMQREYKMSLRAWRECHGYPWHRPFPDPIEQQRPDETPRA